jgi:hypothetical protein
MHDVVLPGQGVTHHCPLCQAAFTGLFTFLDRRRWEDATEAGPERVAEVLFDPKKTVNHNPPDCMGRFLPGHVLAKQVDPVRTEEMARQVQQLYFPEATGQ